MTVSETRSELARLKHRLDELDTHLAYLERVGDELMLAQARDLRQDMFDRYLDLEIQLSRSGAGRLKATA
jgi:hypothetical protein